MIPVTLLASDRPTVNAVMKAAGAGRMDDGMEIRIAGKLAWWAPRGRIQLRMATIDPTYTLGRLGEDRDRLLAALRSERLLDRNRSVPMPVLPLRIGLVTSLGSAAHADFRHELERSGIGFRILEADARTQGLDAGRSIAVAIARLAAHGADVVAVVRGGGSRTDLAPFDGEVIARAIALAAVPVVTGIGHEVDRSIADEVAHQSFKTPTACAAGLVLLAASAIERSEVLWAAITATARPVSSRPRIGSATAPTASSGRAPAGSPWVSAACWRRPDDSVASRPAPSPWPISGSPEPRPGAAPSTRPSPSPVDGRSPVTTPAGWCAPSTTRPPAPGSSPRSPTATSGAPWTMDDAPGYAAAMAELEQILMDLERADLDVDQLGTKVARAAELIRTCRGPDRLGPTRGRADRRRPRPARGVARLLDGQGVRR